MMDKKIESFRDLIAWQKAMDLASAVYEEVRRLPRHEIYGLASQLRRATVSVPSNIAEGWGRGRTPDFTRCLRISRGSLFEVATQAELCSRAGYDGAWVSIVEQADELARILHGLIRSAEKTNRTSL